MPKVFGFIRMESTVIYSRVWIKKRGFVLFWWSSLQMVLTISCSKLRKKLNSISKILFKRQSDYFWKNFSSYFDSWNCFSPVIQNFPGRGNITLILLVDSS